MTPQDDPTMNFFVFEWWSLTILFCTIGIPDTTSWSISVLLGFDPIPVIHSTKCKPFTCKLTDGMSFPGVVGVEVLVSWHVGHGVFEALQDAKPHLGWWHVLHIAILRSPFDLVLCDLWGDVILFATPVPIVLRGPLFEIAPPSTILPWGSRSVMTVVCLGSMCVLCLLTLQGEYLQRVREWGFVWGFLCLVPTPHED